MDRIGDLSELVRALHARRLELKLTQEDVAVVAGLNRRVVGQLERGEIARVSFDTVLRIATTLGLDLELRPRDR